MPTVRHGVKVVDTALVQPKSGQQVGAEICLHGEPKGRLVTNTIRAPTMQKKHHGVLQKCQACAPK